MPDCKLAQDPKIRDNRALVAKVRKFFRNSGYLLEPFIAKPHVSITSKNLHIGLFDFTATALKNIDTYIESKLSGAIDDLKLQIVYTTEEEYLEASKIENFTKDEIELKIHEVINQFSPDERKLHEESFKKNVKYKAKQVYVSFYYEIAEELARKDDQDISDDCLLDD